MVKYLKELSALGLSADEYYIGGSAALSKYGYPKENDDIDICITKNAFERIKSKLVPGKKDGIHNDKFTDISGKIDITVEGTGIPELDISKMFKNTKVLDGFRYIDEIGLLDFYRILYEHYKLAKYKDKFSLVVNNLMIKDYELAEMINKFI